MQQAEPFLPTSRQSRLRWWVEFSLLLLPFLAVAIWFAFNTYQAWKQRTAIAAIKAAGGYVHYDFQMPQWGQIWVSDYPRNVPHWLVDILGVDFFANAREVSAPEQFTDADLEHVKSLTKVRWLYFARTKVTNSGLAYLKNLGALEIVDLRDTSISDAGLHELKEHSKLEGLMLERTKVTDAGLAYVKGWPALSTLNLQGTQVTDAGLQHLAGMKQLYYLDLSDTRVTDGGLQHLKGLSRLKSLTLPWQGVTRSGVMQLKKSLPSCQIIPDFAHVPLSHRLKERVSDHHGLRIEFIGGGLVEVTSPFDASAVLDEWWICVPDSRYVEVGSGGTIVAGGTNCPQTERDL